MKLTKSKIIIIVLILFVSLLLINSNSIKELFYDSFIKGTHNYIKTGNEEKNLNPDVNKYKILKTLDDFNGLPVDSKLIAFNKFGDYIVKNSPKVNKLSDDYVFVHKDQVGYMDIIYTGSTNLYEKKIQALDGTGNKNDINIINNISFLYDINDNSQSYNTLDSLQLSNFNKIVGNKNYVFPKEKKDQWIKCNITTTGNFNFEVPKIKEMSQVTTHYFKVSKNQVFKDDNKEKQINILNINIFTNEQKKIIDQFLENNSNETEYVINLEFFTELIDKTELGEGLQYEVALYTNGENKYLKIDSDTKINTTGDTDDLKKSKVEYDFDPAQENLVNIYSVHKKKETENLPQISFQIDINFDTTELNIELADLNKKIKETTDSFNKIASVDFNDGDLHKYLPPTVSLKNHLEQNSLIQGTITMNNDEVTQEINQIIDQVDNIKDLSTTILDRLRDNKIIEAFEGGPVVDDETLDELIQNLENITLNEIDDKESVTNSTIQDIRNAKVIINSIKTKINETCSPSYICEEDKNPAPSPATGEPMINDKNPAPSPATGEPMINDKNPAPSPATGEPMINDKNPPPSLAPIEKFSGEYYIEKFGNAPTIQDLEAELNNLITQLEVDFTNVEKQTIQGFLDEKYGTGSYNGDTVSDITLNNLSYDDDKFNDVLDNTVIFGDSYEKILENVIISKIGELEPNSMDNFSRILDNYNFFTNKIDELKITIDDIKNAEQFTNFNISINDDIEELIKNEPNLTDFEYLSEFFQKRTETAIDEDLPTDLPSDYSPNINLKDRLSIKLYFQGFERWANFYNEGNSLEDIPYYLFSSSKEEILFDVKDANDTDMTDYISDLLKIDLTNLQDNPTYLDALNAIFITDGNNIQGLLEKTENPNYENFYKKYLTQVSIYQNNFLTKTDKESKIYGVMIQKLFQDYFRLMRINLYKLKLICEDRSSEYFTKFLKGQGQGQTDLTTITENILERFSTSQIAILSKIEDVLLNAYSHNFTSENKTKFDKLMTVNRVALLSVLDPNNEINKYVKKNIDFNIKTATFFTTKDLLCKIIKNVIIVNSKEFIENQFTLDIKLYEIRHDIKKVFDLEEMISKLQTNINLDFPDVKYSSYVLPNPSEIIVKENQDLKEEYKYKIEITFSNGFEDEEIKHYILDNFYQEIDYFTNIQNILGTLNELYQIKDIKFIVVKKIPTYISNRMINNVTFINSNDSNDTITENVKFNDPQYFFDLSTYPDGKNIDNTFCMLKKINNNKEYYAQMNEEIDNFSNINLKQCNIHLDGNTLKTHKHTPIKCKQCEDEKETLIENFNGGAAFNTVINNDPQPATGGQKTANGGQQIANGGQQTANEGQQTATGGQQTATGGQQTATGGQQTANEEEDCPSPSGCPVNNSANANANANANTEKECPSPSDCSKSISASGNNEDVYTQMMKTLRDILEMYKNISSGNIQQSSSATQLLRDINAFEQMTQMYERLKGSDDENVKFMQQLLVLTNQKMTELMEKITDNKQVDGTQSKIVEHEYTSRPNLPNISQFKPTGTSNIFSPVIDIKTDSPRNNERFADAFKEGYEHAQETNNGNIATNLHNDGYINQYTPDTNSSSSTRSTTNSSSSTRSTANNSSSGGSTTNSSGNSRSSNNSVTNGYIRNPPDKNKIGMPGYSYLDPEYWDVPQRQNPVCIPESELTRGNTALDPAGYLGGGNSNVMEFHGVGSILPKFNYTEDVEYVNDNTNRI